jgi:hypothetical protein
MSVFDALRPAKQEGTIAISIAARPNITDAPIRLAETHDSPFSLFAHLCFVFEDLTYILPEVGGAIVRFPQHRAHMRGVLQESCTVLRKLALFPDRFTGHVFAIASLVVPAVSGELALDYRSDLMRRGEQYEFHRSRPGVGILSEVVVEPPYQHNAALALFDHLLARALGSDLSDLELFRIFSGIQALSSMYESANAFRLGVMLNSEYAQKVPRAAIAYAASLERAQLQSLHDAAAAMLLEELEADEKSEP